MNHNRIDISWWLIGLAMFACIIGLGAFAHGGTPFTIVDHQAAATAERVDEIQQAWKDAGVRGLSIVAMLGDLVFIGVYSFGAWRAGLSCRARPLPAVRMIGALVLAAAVVFCVTDYVETSLQMMQMMQDRGSDWMASVAAFMQPVKIVSWVVTFLGINAALIADRIAGKGA